MTDKHIFLIGFMGVGKSTVAAHLSRMTGRPCVDTDALIEKQAGMTVRDIFAGQGEAAFRDMETALLQALKGQSPMIISCGGGMALRRENASLMQAAGTVVLLTACPETILKRVEKDDSRPLLQGHKDVPYIGSLMAKRLPFYEGAAQVIVATDGRSGQEIAEEILRKL